MDLPVLAFSLSQQGLPNGLQAGSIPAADVF